MEQIKRLFSDHVVERIAAAKSREAHAKEQVAEHEEEVQLLIEEQLGVNPDAVREPFPGVRWSFERKQLPGDVHACGCIDTIPDGDGYFVQVDQRAFLTCANVLQRLGAGPAGLINRYSLTLWVRLPQLPRTRLSLLEVRRERDQQQQVCGARRGV